MKKYLLLLLPIFLVACAPSESTSSNPASSADGSSIADNNSSVENNVSFNGTVYLLKNEAETPLADVVFKLTDSSSSYVSTTSDDQGNFSFADVKKGNYTFSLFISPDGIKDFTSYEISVNENMSSPKIVLEAKSINWSDLN